jgi:protein-S-isoprenylcysteine O-methyltransferase Ste14
MNVSWIRAILLLPCSALVYVPVFVVWLSSGTRFAASFHPDTAIVWIPGVVFAVVGSTLMTWAAYLYMTRGGGGTPAPWDPIKNFIVLGPYRYVRNPMLIGVILLQCAEAILLQSWGLVVWTLAFFILNALWFKYYEEPQLIERFGGLYSEYLRKVPRWIPRLRPYEPEGLEGSTDN